MATPKELTGHDEKRFEELHAEIKKLWASTEPRLKELAALAREVKENRLYLVRFSTYDDYARATFGRTGKAMDALVWREEKKAKEAPKEKYSVSSTSNLEYVGTELESKDKPMPARKLPGGHIEHNTPPPPPQATTRQSTVPAFIIELVNEIVRETNRLQHSEDSKFLHDRAFCHLVEQVLKLQRMVQPSLPGMDEHFAKTAATPITATDIYDAYPLKVGKPVAIAAIEKQMKITPAIKLLELTKLFASTRNGNLEFCPHPSTWFNQQRFNDDPSTWKSAANSSNSRKGFDRNAGTFNEGRASDYDLSAINARKLRPGVQNPK